MREENFVRSYQGKALNLDQVKTYAPSIFAERPWEGVSDRYTFIPTFKVVESLISEGWQIMQAQQQRVRIAAKREFTKHLLRLRRENAVAVNDVFPEIVLINSHDRGSAYQMMAGLFRLVCTNGLIVSDSTFASISVRHSGNVIDDVLHGADLIANHTPKLLTGINQMQEIELTKTEQGIYAEAAKVLKYGENSPLVAEKLLVPRRSSDNRNDLWSTFNIVQENITKGGNSYFNPAHRDEGNYKPARRGRTRGIKGLQEDTRINKALWLMAEKMKELKLDGQVQN